MSSAFSPKGLHCQPDDEPDAMRSPNSHATTTLTSTPIWKIDLLYDGACPLCVREVNFLRRRDGGRGWVQFTDIASPDYDPTAHGGVDFATAMGRIHAVFPDGTVIRNIAVFRAVYEVLGMGWIYAITRLPIVGEIADWLYGIWADYRLPLTGRPPLDEILRDRQSQCVPGDRCRLDQ